MGNIDTLRESIADQILDRESILQNPVAQFDKWYRQAAEAQIFQFDAMSLATATADATPSVRMVLLNRFDEKGFIFFTSYSSRKGAELAENPRATLLFWWGPLFRQVRIDGRAAKLDERECDLYFTERPRQHQMATWASAQSQEILSKELLAAEMEMVGRRYESVEIPRPASFGGYRVRPEVIEFWQGRRDWLHDWLRYRRNENGDWLVDRLSP